MWRRQRSVQVSCNNRGLHVCSIKRLLPLYSTEHAVLVHRLVYYKRLYMNLSINILYTRMTARESSLVLLHKNFVGEKKGIKFSAFKKNPKWVIPESTAITRLMSQPAGSRPTCCYDDTEEVLQSFGLRGLMWGRRAGSGSHHQVRPRWVQRATPFHNKSPGCGGCKVAHLKKSN